MKIFISHSGNKSTAITKALRDWLPHVIQVIEPWMSTEDIGKGASWAPAIAVELQRAQLGVICLTSENLDATWILFETGALFNNLDSDYVCPYLFDMDPSALKDPLTWFQATKADKEDTRRLVHTINKALGDKRLTNDIVDSAFNKFWPDLEEKLKGIRSSSYSGTKTKPSDSEILEELLKLARDEARWMSRFLEELLELTRDDARLRSRSRGKHIPKGYIKLIRITEGTLKSNEKIEQVLVGNYKIEASLGNYEIIKGLLAATNHRVLMVLQKPLFGIRKDSFTYSQITTVSVEADENSISLILPDGMITLYDLSDVDPYQEPKKFQKYIIDKKTRPPKTTNMASDVKIPLSKKKSIFDKIFSFITRTKSD